MRNIKILKQIRLLLLAGLASTPIAMQAQQVRQPSGLEEVAFPVSTKGWYDFRANNNLSSQTLFTLNKQLFSLSATDEMREVKTSTDELGFTHVRYQQYHNGLKIEGAEAITHHNGSYLKSMNGFLVQNMEQSSKSTLTENTALDKALQSMSSKAFVWKNKELAEQLSESVKDFDLKASPRGELLYCRKNWNGDFSANNIALAYKFRVIVAPMHESKDVYVDANTGEILHHSPLQTNCNPSNGNTNWYGNKQVYVSYHGFPNNTYWLETQCAGEPLIRSRRGDPILPYNYGDADGVFTDADGVNGYNQRSGVTTMLGITESYLYYKYVHNRNSFDGSNGTVDAYSEITGGLWLPSAENASWNTVTHHMSFGAGVSSSPTDDWNSYDIVGHEFTHGVHQYSVGNNYSGEPGALDESFADIFGEIIEAQAKGTALPDWLMGADRGAHIRNMSNPNQKYQPDTYLGTYWQSTSDPYDYYGVHTNSGVQNFWFYLLTVGGTGTNDLGVNYGVSGIGLYDAKLIAYRSLDTYMLTSSNYFDARESAIHAANDLFGACSNQSIQCGRAWHAVGVANYSPAYDKAVPCGNIANGNYIRAVNTIATQNCVTTALSGTDTRMIAVTGITLNPGFTAQTGANFAAYLDVCSYAAFSRLGSSNTVRGDALTSSSINPSDVNVFPNPSNQLVAISINIKATTLASVTLTDITGRTILKVLENKELSTGKQTVNFDVSAIENGTYLCVLKFGNEVITKKIMVSH